METKEQHTARARDYAGRHPERREAARAWQKAYRDSHKNDSAYRAKRLEYDRKFKAAHRDMLNKKQQEKRKNLSQEEQAAFREKDKLEARIRRSTPEGRAKSRISHKRGLLKNRYGLSLEAWEHMRAEQNDLCAVCGVKFTFVHETNDFKRNACSVDHDHITGKVRALLCNTCNAGLGYFKDDISRVKLALAYLSKDFTSMAMFERYRFRTGDEAFEALRASQNNKCAVCDAVLVLLRESPGARDKTCAVDHDHVTGRVRGLLCNSCNVGIGYFDDNPAVLASALSYLEKWAIKRTSVSVDEELIKEQI